MTANPKIPTQRQLECWCAVHGIQITYGNLGISLLSVGFDDEPICHITTPTKNENLQEPLNQACEKMAFELCLVSPQQALNL